MGKGVFSGRALADVERLHAFLAEKNEAAAARAVTEIRAALRTLEQFPASGRPIEDLPPETREWVVPFGTGAYVMRYRIDADQVTVMRVRHSREAGF